MPRVSALLVLVLTVIGLAAWASLEALAAGENGNGQPTPLIYSNGDTTAAPCENCLNDSWWGRVRGCLCRWVGCCDKGFNCCCRGSYKFPVPPQYTYHWPGIYSQQTMTEYVSPYRFPPLRPLVLDEGYENGGVKQPTQAPIPEPPAENMKGASRSRLFPLIKRR